MSLLGGDDLKMKAWDVREGCTRAISTNSRYEAAVLPSLYADLPGQFRSRCHIHPKSSICRASPSGWQVRTSICTPLRLLPNEEFIYSYDNTVRLFDTRKLLKPLIQADVGGGAWRVKWHPSCSRKDYLLVASMHDGAKVLRFQNDVVGTGTLSFENEKAGWEITSRFDKHESMVYGVDWRHRERGDESLIASCSFYDHVLHTWRG